MLKKRRAEEEAEKTKFKTHNIENDYQIGQEIGSGQFAVVRACVQKSSGKKVAAKFIKKKQTKSSRRGVARIDVVREVKILKMLNNVWYGTTCEHVMKLYDVYEDRQKVILIVELVAGGELFEYLSENEFLEEPETACIMKQVLTAVAFLHNKRVAHLDLKPENIMLLNKEQRPPVIKLIDFGLSQHIVPGQDVSAAHGTPEFVAPEVLAYEPVGFPADIWSIGVITYILLSGCSPFLGDDKQETFERILDIDYEFDEEIFSHVSEDAKGFIATILQRNPRHRPGAKKCLKIPWVNSGPSVETPSTPVIERTEAPDFKLPAGPPPPKPKKPSPLSIPEKPQIAPEKIDLDTPDMMTEEQPIESPRIKPLPAPTIRDLEIDEFSATGSMDTFLSFDTSSLPSATSLPITRQASVHSSDGSDSPDLIEKAASDEEDDEEYHDAQETQSSPLKSQEPTPSMKKRSESCPDPPLPVEIKCQSMLNHQKRLNAMIPIIQANQRALYTKHRRLEEDIAVMLTSSELEHARQIPCTEIRHGFDQADVNLEQLREQFIEANGANRRAARGFAEKLTAANLQRKINQRNTRLDELKKKAQEQLDWMKSISLDREIDDIVQQLTDVQSEIGNNIQ